MARRVDSHTLKGMLLRSNTRLLLTSVMLLQFTALLLLSFKRDPIDAQALLMSLLLPGLTWGVVNLYGKLWQVDRALLILVMLLCSVGLITLQDIARAAITPLNQALFVLMGMVAMAAGIVLMRRLRRWDRWQPFLMAGAALFLLSPLVIGEWNNGAKNWIKLPFVNQSIQPSEFVKPLLIVVLAGGLAGRPRFWRCLPALAFAGGLCALLLLERDLGALLIYFLTTVAVYYAATSNALVTLFGLGIGAGGALIAYHAFPYVQKRIEMFINPWSDPRDSGWQIIQALISIGSGWLFGMGLGLGYPRNIPLYHSDFIFAALSEEFGLIFALMLLVVYLLIVLRGMSVALNARTSFHALTALGVVVLLGVQAFINVGGNIKMIPLTGVTLPFISAGGSSMVSMCLSFGLLLGVSSINAHDEADDLTRMTWREAGG
ncbi:FtsW/RodA/SpoVE family cell cycle protein [Bacillota bacterium Meth-B3]